MVINCVTIYQMEEKQLYENPKFLMGTGMLLIAITIGWFLIDLGIMFPPSFTEAKTIEIAKGADARTVVNEFYSAGIVRRPYDFLLYLKLTGRARTIKPGSYIFKEPISVPAITSLITSDTAERQIRILEGWTNYEIADYLATEGIVEKNDFLKFAQGLEGYLFPDTYRVFQNASSKEIIDLLHATFLEKVAPFQSYITAKKIPLKNLVIMASLIEKESTNTADDRAIISGILWKRLAAGIPLQVDATLSYLTGKESKDLTTDDLKIASPYNTYRYPGLPAGPIGNPGLDAIKAALFPKQTPYLFYLHDADGNPHYAKTFEEHIANKNKYLR